MKTKLILIKGRKVRCRALTKADAFSQKGDVWNNGFGVKSSLTLHFWNVGGGKLQIYRPLKSKPRTAKAVKREPEIKPVDAWAVAVTIKGKTYIDAYRVGLKKSSLKEINTAMGIRVIPVVISYRKKK